MGIPDYVPDAKKIWDNHYTRHVGDSADPNLHADWDQQQKNRAFLADKADRLVNAGILSRQTPFTDTTPYQQQVAAARANQLASMDNLRKSAMGQGPSYANALAAQQLGAGINHLGQQMGGGALAARNNMLAGNQALGQAGALGAQARGTEMGNAMNAYGTGAQAIRGGDLAGQQAALQQIGRYQSVGLQGAKGNQGLVQGLEGLALDSNLAKTKAAQDWYDYWIKEQGAQANNNAQSVGAGAAAFASIAGMMAAAGA